MLELAKSAAKAPGPLSELVALPFGELPAKMWELETRPLLLRPGPSRWPPSALTSCLKESLSSLVRALVRFGVTVTGDSSMRRGPRLGANEERDRDGLGAANKPAATSQLQCLSDICDDVQVGM